VIATPCFANVAVFDARPADSGAAPSGPTTTQWKDLQTQAAKYGFKVE
jgi:hypothetical protein